MAHSKPCIEYGDTLDVTEMDHVKIETVVGGAVRKKVVPVFTAKYGVEGLFHVIDKFVKASAWLHLAPAEKWDQGEECLDTVAESKWTNLIQGIANNAKTAARLTREIANFVALYAEDPEPRDVLIAYLKTDECRKKRKIDPGVHASRIETLCRYANRLNGTEQELTDDQIKKIVFETFPNKWQNDYKKSNRDFAADTITNIVSYMNLCKGIADDEEETRGKKRKAEHIRGGGENSDKKNQNKKGNKKSNKVDDNDTCPVHGGHKWGVCSLNPRGENWRGSAGSGRYGGRGGRYGGRGGGRGEYY